MMSTDWAASGALNAASNTTAKVETNRKIFMNALDVSTSTSLMRH
jgi:hypothetical protein